MKSLFIILAILYGSWHFTDLSSPNAISGLIMPIVFFFGLIALGFWLVLKGGMSGKSDGSHCSGGSSFGSFGDGGGGGGE